MKTSIKIINRKIINIALILLITLCSLYNSCCIAEEGKVLKIGVVNMKNLENCLYAKELQKRLEKEFNPRNDKLQSKKQELQSKQDLFQRDKAILSEKERITRERELTKLQQELQHMFESLDTEVKSRQQEEFSAFNKTIDNTVTNFAIQEKYDVILPDQILMYNSDSLDCTNKIVAALDAQFKSKK